MTEQIFALIERVNARMPSSVTPSTRIEIHPADWLTLVDEIERLQRELAERDASFELDGVATALCVDPAFEGTRCPFTQLPYFMHLEHPELGRVPTYGGPYDSYTIPVPDDDDKRTLRSERYDHDEGAWIEGGELRDRCKLIELGLPCYCNEGARMPGCDPEVT